MSYDRAVAVGLTDLVRGYEGVKLANVDNYLARLRSLGIDTTDLLDN